MVEKIGRNDPCPCGSGKKFKQCCINLQTGKKKIKAKWLNVKKETLEEGHNLLERTFGSAIAAANEPFVPKKDQETSEKEEN